MPLKDWWAWMWLGLAAIYPLWCQWKLHSQPTIDTPVWQCFESRKCFTKWMVDYFQAQHVESLHAGSSELCRLYRGECFYMFVSDPCLANSAKLKGIKSRNPSPPSSFGRHILSQLNQAIFFFICLPLPKSKYHGCHFIAKVVWQLENIHGICRNRLGYRLNEYLLSYVWE